MQDEDLHDRLDEIEDTLDRIEELIAGDLPEQPRSA